MLFHDALEADNSPSSMKKMADTTGNSTFPQPSDVCGNKTVSKSTSEDIQILSILQLSKG